MVKSEVKSQARYKPKRPKKRNHASVKKEKVKTIKTQKRKEIVSKNDGTSAQKTIDLLESSDGEGEGDVVVVPPPPKPSGSAGDHDKPLEITECSPKSPPPKKTSTGNEITPEKRRSVERVNLWVPFREKDTAKGMGCEWDWEGRTVRNDPIPLFSLLFLFLSLIVMRWQANPSLSRTVVDR